MNKKKLALIIGAAAVIVIVTIVSTVIAINSNKDQPGTITDGMNNSSSDTGDTIVNTVDDFKDNLNTDNVNTILGNCTKLMEKYTLSENQFKNGIKFEQGWRIESGKVIEGEGETDKEEFKCTISEGINESPDLSLTFTTSVLTQEEVEEMAYEVIKNLSNDDMVDLMAGIEYNSLDMADVNDKVLENITFTKEKIESDAPEVEIDPESGDIITTDTYLSTYIYGIKYIPKEDKLVSSFVQEDYDKKIYMGIPIFNQSGISDINDPMLFTPWIVAQNVTDIALTSYGYTTGNDSDECKLSISSVASGGETLSTEISINYNENTNLVDYSFTTMTGYNETPESALDSAIKLFNSITGMSTSLEDYSSMSEPNNYGEQSFLYFELPDNEDDILANAEEIADAVISVDIKYEPELGYYAYIMAS